MSIIPGDLSSEIACETVINQAIQMMNDIDTSLRPTHTCSNAYCQDGLDYLVLNHITNSHYGLWFNHSEYRKIPKSKTDKNHEQKLGLGSESEDEYEIEAKSHNPTMADGALYIHPYVEEMFKVNALSYIWLTTYAMPYLQHNKRWGENCSQITVLSSFAGTTGIPNTALYSSTKHALVGFFDSLRYIYGVCHCVCHCVCHYAMTSYIGLSWKYNIFRFIY